MCAEICAKFHIDNRKRGGSPLNKKRATVKELEEKFEDTAFRLTQERNDFLLPQVVDFVRKERWINLRPEYQRRTVWDVPKRSLFIESLLLNIPIPPIFLFEHALSRYEVMDGQQRLSSVADFYENGFALKGLEKWSELNGLRYRDLPETLQRGLDRRRISANVLLAESTKKKEFTRSDIRKLVFERLNTGGQTLNAQELRNCLYAGEFNDLLTRLAGNELFTEIWEIPSYAENVDKHGVAAAVLRDNSLYKRMLDCQIALRFFALRDSAAIKGSVRTMLDDCMEKNQNITREEANEFEALYLEMLGLAHQIFGKHVFRIKNPKGKWELSIPLYDGIMVALFRLRKLKEQLVREKVSVAQRVEKLIEDPKAYEVIVGRPNTAQAIRDRLTSLTKAMEA
jgi:Protein of unknown function DUF262